MCSAVVRTEWPAARSKTVRGRRVNRVSTVPVRTGASRASCAAGESFRGGRLAIHAQYHETALCVTYFRLTPT
jgi:hypothetical protein